MRFLIGVVSVLVLFQGEYSRAEHSYNSSGVAHGDVRWKAKFNLNPCDRKGKKKGTWCNSYDYGKANTASGVTSELERVIKNPKNRNVMMAYFSFSNKRIREVVCEALRDNQKLNYTLYINSGNYSSLKEHFESVCADVYDRITVNSVGVAYGSKGGHLQHMKITLASTLEDPLPYSLLKHLEKKEEGWSELANEAKNSRTQFTSSSANMSAAGTGLHFENWLFFDAPTTDILSQLNICVFRGLEKAKNPLSESGWVKETDSRQTFVDEYKKCSEYALAHDEIYQREDIEYYAVPHGGVNPQPFPRMRTIVKDAEEEVKVAIHRMTGKVSSMLAYKSSSQAEVKVVMDDDNLRASVEHAGEGTLDMTGHDVKALRTLLRKWAKVKVMETNGEIRQLHHNKFVVVDPYGYNPWLFQGAGNFTAKALDYTGNSATNANYEQFYVINDPDIVGAYDKGFRELYKRATAPEDHEDWDNEFLCTGAPLEWNEDKQRYEEKYFKLSTLRRSSYRKMVDQSRFSESSIDCAEDIKDEDVWWM